MEEQVITSTANPLVKRIRALEQRNHREVQHAFFVEGIRPVWQALERGAEVEALLIAPDLLKSGSARHFVEQQGAKGVRVVPVSRRVFESIADRENPSGLGAIVRTWSLPLDSLAVTPRAFFVALKEAGNPGNLGTIIRTVDAVGGSGIILVGTSTDPFHPTAVKASMGSLFGVPLARVERLAELVTWARARGVQIVTTCSKAPRLFWSAEFARPALFLFGSEGRGLGDLELAAGDLAVRIPMQGSADSLNLAVSVGVLLYEVIRRDGS